MRTKRLRTNEERRKKSKWEWGSTSTQEESVLSAAIVSRSRITTHTAYKHTACLCLSVAMHEACTHLTPESACHTNLIDPLCTSQYTHIRTNTLLQNPPQVHLNLSNNECPPLQHTFPYNLKDINHVTVMPLLSCHQSCESPWPLSFLCLQSLLLVCHYWWCQVNVNLMTEDAGIMASNGHATALHHGVVKLVHSWISG